MQPRLDDSDSQASKPFLAHLEDLRNALIRSMIALGLGMLIAAPAAPYLMAILRRPLKGLTPDPAVFLQSLEVAGAISLSLQIAFWGGLLLSAPALVYYIGGFIFPGLTPRERGAVVRSSGFTVLLFAVGVAMGYFIMLPLAIQVMLSTHAWLGITPQWTIRSYMAFAFQLLIGFGLAFEFPLVVFVLAQLGLVSARQLREKRKVVIVVILVISAVLTPPDVMSQLIMAVPLLLLYEVCVWLVWWRERAATRAVVRARPET